MHLLASLNIGNRYHCESLQRCPELEDVSVLGFVKCSATTDDVYLMHVLLVTYIDNPYPCGHGRPIEPTVSRHTPWTRAHAQSKMELLLFFECQCRGVKFYDLQSAGARYGTRLKLVREPTNLQDPLNCVAAWVPPGPWSSDHWASCMLGHIAKEAARWLNPLLDSCFRVTR